jgi:hypothetical protein
MDPSREDPFEQRLRSQALRPLPPEWRQSILGNARPAPAAGALLLDWFRGGLDQFRGGLWPSPAAWGALAALWLAITVLNRIAAFEAAPDAFAANLDPAPLVLALREQRRQVDEFLSPAASSAPEDTAEPPGRPRSAVISTNRIA